jgi:hypothetical protein
MATDDAAQLAERFREIRQEWDLRSGEAETQAQNKALAPLHAWLRTGVNSPEVVIRAVQVLMADPERPAIHKRHAVNYVFKQISKAWESAGLKEQDVLILRGMLLAAWPQALGDGGFALAPLLNSAWACIPGRFSKQGQLEEWREHLVTSPRASSPAPSSKPPSEAKITEGLKALKAPDHASEIAEIQRSSNHYTSNVATSAAQLFKAHQDILSSVTGQLNTQQKVLKQFETTLSGLSDRVSNTSHALSQLNETVSQADQLDLLWWGQARYSSITRLPYRRIADDTERLWWMAWESSELATALEVEPAACFLIETLYQLDKRVDAPKRPLKEWLDELLEALRRIHGKEEQHANAMTMSDQLETLAREDALGLPVTWARLQAANSKPFEGSIEERIRTDIAVDPDTLLDLGDWAAWIFRESLLDRRLAEFGEQ